MVHGGVRRLGGGPSLVPVGRRPGCFARVWFNIGSWEGQLVGAEVFHLKPEKVRGFARNVDAASDAIGALRIDSVLSTGASACPGTDLVAGLQRHATEQHTQIQALSRDLDGFGDTVIGAIDSFLRLDGGRPEGQTPPADRDA